MLELKEYVDARGLSPFRSWFDDLDAPAAAKITVALGRIEQGNLSGVKGVARERWSDYKSRKRSG